MVLVSSYVTLIAGRRGDAPRQVDETLDLPPGALAGPYPRSKRLAELAALAADPPAVVVLPSAPVGPGDHGPTPPGAMLCDLAAGRLPAMIDCLWSLVDVRALAAGVIAALDRGEAGERYLMAGDSIGTDALTAMVARASGRAGPRARVPHALALAAAGVSEGLSRLTGRPPGAPLTGVRLAGPRISFDSAKARAALGFAPGDPEVAIRDALAWFAAEGRIAPPMRG